MTVGFTGVTKITDDSGTVLFSKTKTINKDYATFKIFPNTNNEQIFALSRTGFSIETPAYDEWEVLEFNTNGQITKIETSSGLTESITYDKNFKVQTHSLYTGHSLDIVKNYTYDTKSQKSTTTSYSHNIKKTIEYTQTDTTLTETHTEDGCTTTITQQKAYDANSQQTELTTTIIYKKNNQSSSPLIKKIIFDKEMNLIKTQNDGIITEYTYYTPSQNRDRLVQLIPYSRAKNKARISSATDLVEFIYDGTVGAMLDYYKIVERHQIVEEPKHTKNGKELYNLPVTIEGFGDAPFFVQFLESEKTYTYENENRRDLHWIFYGYKKLNRLATAQIENIQPSVKISIRNPSTSKLSSYTKLESWEGAIVEETKYYDTVATDSISYGRIEKLSSRILDAAGQTVPHSPRDIQFNYVQVNKTTNDIKTSELTTQQTSIINGLIVSTEQTASAFNGDTLETIDTLGNKTAYTYDSLGRTIRVEEFAQDPSFKKTTHVSYKVENRKTTVTTTTEPESSYPTAIEYDALGRPINIKSKSPASETWLLISAFSYDEYGRQDVVQEYDYRLSPDDEPLSGSDRPYATKQFIYDGWGNNSIRTNSQTNIDEHTIYDPINKRLEESVIYKDTHSSKISITSANSNNEKTVEEYYYNNGALTRSSTLHYDIQERLVKQKDPHTGQRSVSYDRFDRPVKETLDFVNGVGTIQQYTYPNSNTSSTILSIELSALEPLAGEDKSGTGKIGSRVFDGLNRLTQLTVGRRVEDYVYEGLQSFGAYTRPSISTREPRSSAQVQSVINPKKGTLIETVIRANEPSMPTSNDVDNSVTATYSLRGKLLSLTNAFGDKFDFIETEDELSSEVNNKKIRTKSIFSPTTRLLLQERVTDTSNNITMVIDFSYDEQSREVKRQFSAPGLSPLILTRAFTADGRIDSTRAEKDGELLLSQIYSYTASGQLESCNYAGKSLPLNAYNQSISGEYFYYDKRGTLTSLRFFNTIGEGFTQTYVPNPFDSVQVSHITFKQTQSAAANTKEIFIFDEAGYLKNLDQIEYTYSSNGQLSSVTSPQGLYAYSYDTTGRLTACKGPGYYDEFHYIGEHPYARNGYISENGALVYRCSVLLNTSNSCVLMEQRKKPHLDDNPAVSFSFELKDFNDTTIASFNSENKSFVFYSYTVFGYRPVTTNEHSWTGFNGQPIDLPTGCYYLGNGARLYSPAIRRFLAPDRKSPFNEGGINEYSYCENDPVNYYDPSGQARVVHEYTTVNNLLDSRIATAVILGGVGIILAPFTGGTSIGWSIAVIGLAIVSAGFGIAAAYYHESDPELSEALDNASLATGLFGGLLGAGKTAGTAAARYSSNKLLKHARATRDRMLMGATVNSMRQVDGELFTFIDTYKKADRLNIVAHSKTPSVLDMLLSRGSSMLANREKLSPNDLLKLLQSAGINPTTYKNTRILSCFSANGGADSFAAQFGQLIQRPVKGYKGPLLLNLGATTTQNRVSALRAAGGSDATIASYFEQNQILKIDKTNPWKLFKQPRNYMIWRYSPVHFPFP
ncbi:hypothetical protein IFT48_09820 [Pseudomonas fluorescens]|uniref:RHS repeat-associated core domain-containing protein n=1 Tax=Pseudomonas fluorescens TaxID=294 RepID=UPI00190504D0|nr:RHS repeat-associated core domain-containing protein [Pseudomonas fluorescens]MBD8090280.1 hypothetical protein [Pseudomonas fluorescens]MBD8716518.1 hypothetical protein [Pseudomonas fluorescens]